MTMDGGKKTFCSLYTFVKEHNPKLYELLEDMCAVGLFRPRFPTTFLNPGSDIVEKLSKLINDGESEKAFHQLQKLFIHGKHTSLKGELVTNGRNLITDNLSSLKQDGKYQHWESRDNSIVYSYDSKDFPTVGKEIVAIPKTERKSKGKGVSGSWFGSSDSKVQITKELMESGGGSDLQKKVAYKLNSLLKFIYKDTQLFEKLSKKMDSNLILSWYILVQPGKTSDQYISDHLFNTWCEQNKTVNLSELTTIKQIFEKSNSNDTSDLMTAKTARTGLNEDGFDMLLNSIKNAYGNDKLKLLEDELRFRYSNETEIDSHVVNELNSINWDDPEASLVLIRSPSKGCLYKPSLFKLMKEFVNSSAFLYVLYNSTLYNKFKERLTSIGGAGSKKMINLLGSNNRDFIGGFESPSGDFLANIVGSLDPEQKAILKSLLD